jgi:hypothetical protein
MSDGIRPGRPESVPAVEELVHEFLAYERQIPKTHARGQLNFADPARPTFELKERRTAWPR